MSKRINSKPLTIKEYTKNYKFPDKEKITKENYYINRTKNNFISKILKNKNIAIKDDDDINKTIENIFHKEENKQKIMKILKRRNHKITYTSEGLSISKINTRDKSKDSIYDNNKIKKEKSFDFHTPNKKYNKIKIFTKRPNINNINRAITPLVNNRTKKKIIIYEKIKNKNNNNNNNSNDNNNKRNNQNIRLSKHLQIKSNKTKIKPEIKKFRNNDDNMNNKDKKIYNNILKIENPLKFKIDRKKPEIKKFKDIYQKNIDNFLIKEKNDKYTGYLLLKKNLGNIEEKIKLNKDNIKEIFINIINELTNEENEIVNKKEILASKEKEIIASKEKEKIYLELKNDFEEFKNKQKEEVKILEDKIKKYENESYQKKIKEFIIEKIEICLVKTNINKAPISKSNNNININNTTNNINNNINNKNTNNNINSNNINKNNNDNINNNIDKNNNDNINNNINNNISIINNNINKVNNNNSTINNKITNTSSINNNITNTNNNINDVNNTNNNISTINNKKEEKLSKALNRIKKKKEVALNNNINNNSISNNIVKKSEKINKIVKMLEEQLSGLKNQKENENNDNNNEINFLKLLDEKPINANKKKPTLKIKFEDK